MILCYKETISFFKNKIKKISPFLGIWHSELHMNGKLHQKFSLKFVKIKINHQLEMKKNMIYLK